MEHESIDVVLKLQRTKHDCGDRRISWCFVLVVVLEEVCVCAHALVNDYLMYYRRA